MVESIPLPLNWDWHCFEQQNVAEVMLYNFWSKALCKRSRAASSPVLTHSPFEPVIMFCEAQATWRGHMKENYGTLVDSPSVASSYVSEPSWTSFNCLSEGTAVISQTQPFSLLPPATFSDIRRVPNCGTLLARSLRVPSKPPHRPEWERKQASLDQRSDRSMWGGWRAGVNGHSQHSSASTWATNY